MAKSTKSSGTRTATPSKAAARPSPAARSIQPPPVKRSLAPPKPATAPAPLAPGERRIRVEALEMVYYDHARRREGDVFTIRERDFSKRSMRRVDPSTPERITTGAEDLRKKHDEILGGRLTERGTIGPSSPAAETPEAEDDDILK